MAAAHLEVVQGAQLEGAAGVFIREDSLLLGEVVPAAWIDLGAWAQLDTEPVLRELPGLRTRCHGHRSDAHVPTSLLSLSTFQVSCTTHTLPLVW